MPTTENYVAPPQSLLMVLNIAAGLIYVMIGVKAMWGADLVALRATPLWITGSMLAAHWIYSNSNADD